MTTSRLLFVLVAVAAILVSLARNVDLVDVAAGDNDNTFDAFVAALTVADLAETLRGDGPFTVFAPTNNAFGKLPPGILDSLLLPENKEKLAAMLLYHVVSGEFLRADLSDGSVATVEGEDICVNVHPRKAVKLNKITKILASDVRASNGVMHVVNRLLIPPSLSAPTDIVETATSHRFLQLFVKAITAADLVDTLKGEGPFTVLAPSNVAFERSSTENWNELLLPQNKKRLRAILSYHIVPTKVLSTELLASHDSPLSLPTLQGETVAVQWREKEGVATKVKWNGQTRVKISDWNVSNGVMHVIHQVLLPPSLRVV